MNTVTTPEEATMRSLTKSDVIRQLLLSSDVTPYKAMIAMQRKGWKVYYSEVLRVKSQIEGSKANSVSAIELFLTRHASLIKEATEDVIRFKRVATKDIKAELAKIDWVVDRSNWIARPTQLLSNV